MTDQEKVVGLVNALYRRAICLGMEDSRTGWAGRLREDCETLKDELFHLLDDEEIQQREANDD